MSGQCGDMPRDFLWGHPFLERVYVVPGQCGDMPRDCLWGHTFLERVYIASGQCGDMLRDCLWGHPFLERVYSVWSVLGHAERLLVGTSIFERVYSV